MWILTFISSNVKVNFESKFWRCDQKKKSLWSFKQYIKPLNCKRLTCFYTKQTKGSSRKTHTSISNTDCAQVIVRRCYLTHLQQEKYRYSICTKQIFKAVQFIRANYWYEVLEVIFLRYMLLSLGHRPSALVWIKALPARLHNGPFGAARLLGGLSVSALPNSTQRCSSPAKFLRDIDSRSV